MAFVSSYTIYIAEEANWNNCWTRDYVDRGHMLNSCVLTKLLGEDGEPDEVVLIVGSNGGAVYTCSLPKVVPDEYLIVDLPTVEELENDPGIYTSLGEGVDQSDVPPGKVRVLKHVPLQEIEIKQCLRYVSREPLETGEHKEIKNINCLAQGKGTYTDYLVGAPDYESRLYIFIRSYEGLEEEAFMSYKGELKDARQTIFELIEQQRNPESILLPIGVVGVPHTEEERAQELKDKERGIEYGHTDYTPNSLNLAWAPWYHRSIIAAGTDSNRLIIYDFDQAQRLLCENEPDTVFRFAESKATILFEATFTLAVRLLKFSPVPSVPILAVCETAKYVTFIDCRTWHIERVALPPPPVRDPPPRWGQIETVVCGLAWELDASAVHISTNQGIFTYKVKLLPSLSDTLMIKMVQDYDCDPSALETLPSAEEMVERFNLLSFGLVRDKNAKVHWMDEQDLVPPRAEPQPIGLVAGQQMVLQLANAELFAAANEL